jgi:Uma2 family endonuclease
MATVPPIQASRKNDYPTSDGKPIAETDWHRNLMNLLIETLKRHYESQDRIYVSGKLLLFYEPGNRRRHISPDVFVVKGIPNHIRPNYLMWEERKGPDVVIEITSSSTRREDQETKFRLYRDTLRVKEYFLFDPYGDYLDPPLQGYRLRGGQYQKIRMVQGRLPSRVLGLHLERTGSNLRLYDPETEAWLPTPREEVRIARAREQQAVAREQQAVAREQQAVAEKARTASERDQALTERDQTAVALDQALAERDQALAERTQTAAERDQALAENERLRQEMERLRQQS